MTEVIDKTRLGSAKKSEAEVRSELLALASHLADKAKSAESADIASVYAESAAVVFGAARLAPRAGGDPIPDGG